MRRILALITTLAAALAALLVGGAGTAAAATTLVYVEQTTSVRFVPAIGAPDPRGPGSVLISEGTLSQDGEVVGTVYVQCYTTRVVDGDYYGYCIQTLVVPGGALFASGEINESALERFVPQSIPIVAGAGVYGGATGTLEIQQTRFPDEFRLTARLR